MTMQKIQPELKKIQEKHKNDKEKQENTKAENESNLQVAEIAKTMKDAGMDYWCIVNCDIPIKVLNELENNNTKESEFDEEKEKERSKKIKEINIEILAQNQQYAKYSVMKKYK